jgi:hypothetical protein
VERVSQIAGTAIPPFSVYSALRTLVKRKVLKAGRQGHEKSYSLAGTPDSSSATSFAASTAPAMARPASIPEPTAMPALEAVAMPSAPAGMPHKLAVGEALILHVGDEHVESVTNVHGRLVVERHPRSK